MKYTIKYDDCSDLYMMGGVPARFIGEHLRDIAIENNIKFIADSESHYLAILEASGLKIELLDSDGSKLDW